MWLIGAVVLAGADILLGTIYLLIIAAAALTAFIFALIGAGILFQLLAFAVFAIAGCVYLSYRKRKNSVSTDADHLQHINDGHSVEVKEWEKKRQSSSFLSRNRLGCQTGKRFTDGSRPLGDRRDERKYFNYQTQTGEIIWKQSEGSPYSSWCWQSLPSSLIAKSVRVVPQQEAWVVERFGKFHTVLQPGLNFIIPIIDRVAYRQTLKEIPMDTSSQICITKDNTQLQVDGVLYFQVTNPELASYGTSDFVMAITQLAQTSLRSVIGTMSLDKTFEEREEINARVVQAVERSRSDLGRESPPL